LEAAWKKYIFLNFQRGRDWKKSLSCQEYKWEGYEEGGRPGRKDWVVQSVAKKGGWPTVLRSQGDTRVLGERGVQRLGGLAEGSGGKGVFCKKKAQQL